LADRRDGFGGQPGTWSQCSRDRQTHHDPSATGRGAKQSAEVFAASFADWDSRLNGARGIAEIIVAKNRHGALHTVKVRFDAEQARFEKPVDLINESDLPALHLISVEGGGSLHYGRGTASTVLTLASLGTYTIAMEDGLLEDGWASHRRGWRDD
jgi:hypothetical protein